MQALHPCASLPPRAQRRFRPMHDQPKRGFLRRHWLAASFLGVVIFTAFYQLEWRRDLFEGCLSLTVNQGDVYLSVAPKRPFLSFEQCDFEFRKKPRLGTLPYLSMSRELVEVSSPVWLFGLVVVVGGSIFEFRHRSSAAT
jgi:hypothetical protein